MTDSPFFFLNAEKEQELFNNSIIVFDTSSLLDFYFYPEENVNELESRILNVLNDRLYIIYHSHFEFLKNKDKVKLKPLELYDALINKKGRNNDSGHIDEIENLIKNTKSSVSEKIKGQLKTLKEKVSKNKHPCLDTTIFSKFSNQIEDLENTLSNFQAQFEYFKKEFIKSSDIQKEKLNSKNIDNVLLLITKHFKITNDLDITKLWEYIKEGEFRYENEIPPGYHDKNNKIGFQKYGDLIIWKEILNLAKTKESNIILVINDLKEDWWYLDERKKHISPRYELIKEFRDTTNNSFWMYDTSKFLHKMNTHLSANMDNSTIKNIEEITIEQHSSLLDDYFFNWMIEYLNMHTINYGNQKLENYYDYTIFTDKGQISIKHIKVKNQSFIILMDTIWNYINTNELNSQSILILEYENLEKLRKLEDKLIKSHFRNVIQKSNINKRIIATLNSNSNYTTQWDSID